MNNIGEKIVELRKNRGITQKELAERIKMSPQNLLKIEKGTVTPRVDTLTKILNALDAEEELFYKNFGESFISRNIRKLMQNSSDSTSEIAKKLNYSKKTLLKIISGELTPNKEQLERIANYFNTTVDNIKSPDHVVLPLEIADLMNIKDNIDLEKEDIIIEISNLNQKYADDMYDPDVQKYVESQTKKIILERMEKLNSLDLRALYFGHLNSHLDKVYEKYKKSGNMPEL